MKPLAYLVELGGPAVKTVTLSEAMAYRGLESTKVTPLVALEDAEAAIQAASQPERGEAVAWMCTRRLDGDKGELLSPFVATNRAYVEVHKGHDWIPLYAHPPAADARVAELERQLAVAYGLLWHVNAGVDAPWGTPSLTPERAAMESRKLLREMLTSEQRGDGINAARDFMKALAADKENTK